jgi:tyrosine-specific transport protein
MQKQIGSIMLVAGTCIGSGMLALPMLLAKIGIIPSILLMIAIWLLAYYTSLIHLELNLQAGTGLDLGQLAKRFCGLKAQVASSLSLQTLMFALLTAYIYGATSIVAQLINLWCGANPPFLVIAAFFSVLVIVILSLPLTLIDYLNRLLFISLLAIVALLIGGLITTIKWSALPLFCAGSAKLENWRLIIPVVFTSFGFQVIFHTLTNYCNKDKNMLKQAFFWGSLTPAVVYIIWTSSVLSTISHNNPLFYDQMISGSIEVGQLIKQLSMIAQWQAVQMLTWFISFLAIFTSVIGVGIGLSDSINTTLKTTIVAQKARTICSAIATIVPAFLVAILVPNAFITVLGFAGMILVLIAIVIPLYLLYKANITHWHYPELQQSWLLILSALAGLIIMGCELLNILL